MQLTTSTKLVSLLKCNNRLTLILVLEVPEAPSLTGENYTEPTWYIRVNYRKQVLWV